MPDLGPSVLAGTDKRHPALSLDLKDETRNVAGHHLVSVWPETGEMACTWRSLRHGGGTGSAEVVPSDDDRAGRRARSKLTRYCVRNDLRRLWSLTCRDQTTDVTLMRSRLSQWERGMRETFGRMPYVVVIERHKSGALHAHVALPATFLDHGKVERVWGHGFVHYRDRRRRALNVGRGRRFQARALAGYLAKYVAKDPVRLEGGHRYEVAEGFQPAVVRRSFGSLGAAVEWGTAYFVVGRGETLEAMWDSSTSTDWRGPPVRYMRFEEAA